MPTKNRKWEGNTRDKTYMGWHVYTAASAHLNQYIQACMHANGYVHLYANVGPIVMR